LHNMNVSQIIEADYGVPDDSLINNKDDLLINTTLQDHDHDENINLNFSNVADHGLQMLPLTPHKNKNKKSELKLEFDEVLDDKWNLFEQ
jgi:hypothetical protein